MGGAVGGRVGGEGGALSSAGSTRTSTARPGSTCAAERKGARRVQLVRRDGRDVSTLYGREGGGERGALAQETGGGFVRACACVCVWVGGWVWVCVRVFA